MEIGTKGFPQTTSKPSAVDSSYTTNGFDQCISNTAMLGAMQAGSGTTLALSSNYVYATSGNAIAARFMCRKSGYLNNAYVFNRTTTGSPGAITCELRTYSSGAASKPQSTLLASTTATPGASTKWIQFTFSTPYYVVANTVYWIIFGDPAGSAGNSVTLQYLSPIVNVEANQLRFSPFTTSDGFTTNGTNSATYQMPPFILNISGKPMGVPYTTTGSYSSNTRPKGWKLDGLSGHIKIEGTWTNNISNVSNIQMFSGNVGSSGTPDTSAAMDINSAGIFQPAYLCLAGGIYRMVFAFSGSSAGPGYYQVEDSTSYVDILKTTLGNGRIYSSIGDGSGGWTDEKDKLPKGYIVLAGPVAPSDVVTT
jgi:hypothetical protein